MNKPMIDVLAERVEALEQENRRWRWGGGFVMVASLVMVVGGAQREDDSKVVEAHQFIVRDKDGKERARLGLASDGAPALFLRSKDGQDRVLLQASDQDDSGSLSLSGGGKERGDLSVILDGGRRASNSPSLTLMGDNEKRINLNVARGPHPWLRFTDEDGTFLQFPEPKVRQLSGP